MSDDALACGPYFYEDSDVQLSELSSQYNAEPLFFKLLSSLPNDHEARPVLRRIASQHFRWVGEEELYQACQPHVQSHFGVREREVRAWCAEHERLHHTDHSKDASEDASAQAPSNLTYGEAVFGPFVDHQTEEWALNMSLAPPEVIKSLRQSLGRADRLTWRDVAPPQSDPWAYQNAREMIDEGLVELPVRYEASFASVLKHLKSAPEPSELEPLDPDIEMALRSLKEPDALYLKGAAHFHRWQNKQALEAFSSLVQKGGGGAAIFMELLLAARQHERPLSYIFKRCGELRDHHKAHPERYIGPLSLLLTCELYASNDLVRYQRHMMSDGVALGWEAESIIADFYHSASFGAPPHFPWLQRRFELVMALPLDDPSSRRFQDKLLHDPLMQALFSFVLHPRLWHSMLQTGDPYMPWTQVWRYGFGDAYYLENAVEGEPFQAPQPKDKSYEHHLSRLLELMSRLELQSGERGLPRQLAGLALTYIYELEGQLRKTPNGGKIWRRLKLKAFKKKWHKAASGDPLYELTRAKRELRHHKRKRAFKRLNTLTQQLALSVARSSLQPPLKAPSLNKLTPVEIGRITRYELLDLAREASINQGWAHQLELTLMQSPPRLMLLSDFAERLLSPKELREYTQKLTAQEVTDRGLNMKGVRLLILMARNRFMRLGEWTQAQSFFKQLVEEFGPMTSNEEFDRPLPLNLSLDEVISFMKRGEEALTQLRRLKPQLKKTRQKTQKTQKTNSKNHTSPQALLDQVSSLQEAVFTMSCVMRHAGLRYFGTFMAPDVGYYGGSFHMPRDPLPSYLKRRKETQARLKKSEREWERWGGRNRFMYRYAASQVAMEAALISPREGALDMLNLAWTWTEGDPKLYERNRKFVLKHRAYHVAPERSCRARLKRAVTRLRAERP